VVVVVVVVVAVDDFFVLLQSDGGSKILRSPYFLPNLNSRVRTHRMKPVQ